METPSRSSPTPSPNPSDDGVGFVDHCNVRTDYEFISHPFQPEICPECWRIEAVLTGQDLA